VFLVTHRGYCLCICTGISVSGRWPCADSVILDVPIDLRCVIVDISIVLLLDAPKVFPNLEDVELQL